jgi:hypothetical protein
MVAGRFFRENCQPGDEFVFKTGEEHYSKNKVLEFVPDKKIVWFVTESKLEWLKKQDEWTDTRMIFDLTTQDNSTILHFVHEGLVPEKESYVACSEGWNLVIKKWLYDYIVNENPHFIL